MTAVSAEVGLPFSPFYAILQDGIERIFEAMKCDPFTFVVSSEKCKSILPETIAISPNSHKELLLNPEIDRFEFAKCFREFAPSRVPLCLSLARALSFLSLCGPLGNERISLALLCAMSGGSPPLLVSNSSPDSAARAPPPAATHATIDECAAGLHLHSAGEHWCLDHQTLHRLLSSSSLSIEAKIGSFDS
jgi:hypothetical protein